MTNKIYYYCHQNMSNHFFEHQKKIINNLGYDLIHIYYSNYKKELIENKPKNSIIILNFIENGRGKGKRLILFYMRWIQILYLCKKSNNKFVFVYHNLSVHDASFIKNIFASCIISILKKHSDAIQLLSHNSISYIKNTYKNKCFVIPHSNYINIYGALKEFNNNNNSLNLLFFGMIKKYKNIEIIIQIAKNLKNNNISFIIMGNKSNNAYYNELIKLSNNLNNIKIIPEFVPNNEIPSVLSKCDALILPYKKKSCLNSGTAILAGSYQKTFICPSIATVKDMPQELVYSYDYDNENDHLIKLQNTIIRMYNDKINNPNILKQKGIKLQEYLKINNSDSVVANAYEKMFTYLKMKEK